LASWVEYITKPLGLVMPIGLVVTRLLRTCAEMVQKWAVLPLSAMAVVAGGKDAGDLYEMWRNK
jgi:hypothetical protein